MSRSAFISRRESKPLNFAAAADDRTSTRKAAADPPDDGLPADHRLLLLAVEDDPEARRYLELALEPDYRVVTVAHGREMREQFGVHGQQIAAVLMDLSLRETEDGLALTRWIRTQPGLRQIPVIA